MKLAHLMPKLDETETKAQTKPKQTKTMLLGADWINILSLNAVGGVEVPKVQKGSWSSRLSSNIY